MNFEHICRLSKKPILIIAALAFSTACRTTAVDSEASQASGKSLKSEIENQLEKKGKDIEIEVGDGKKKKCYGRGNDDKCHDSPGVGSEPAFAFGWTDSLDGKWIDGSKISLKSTKQKRKIKKVDDTDAHQKIEGYCWTTEMELEIKGFDGKVTLYEADQPDMSSRKTLGNLGPVGFAHFTKLKGKIGDNIEVILKAKKSKDEEEEEGSVAGFAWSGRALGFSYVETAELTFRLKKD